MKFSTAIFQIFAVDFLVTTGVRSNEIPTDTYKGCSTPSFEWATYDNRATASFKPKRGAFTNGHIFAAGMVRSNIDTDLTTPDPDAQELSFIGPLTESDGTGASATVRKAKLESYSASAGAIENAGGSWHQYDVGVAKIDANTGEPKDFFSWGGDSLDETAGLAASGDSIAVSGHFTGHLAAPLADGTTKTIWNSNVGEGGVALDEDQFHPNNKASHAETGVDDGFIIKANADTGIADWIVHYPRSNADAEIVGVDFDTSNNVYGAGYSCSKAEDAEFKTCDGVVVMFASSDGELMWEKTFPDVGAFFEVKYDSEQFGGLYVTGTTTYGGSTAGNPKDHPYCDHDSCSVIMRLSPTDGEAQWVRTVKGSPRWGIFDQKGGLALGREDLDGPYIYAAMDDTGEGEVEKASLNTGTPYGGCLSKDGVFTPEYHVFLKKVVVPADCDFFDDSGESIFISRQDPRASPASSVINNVSCGKKDGTDACLMKFHKHTGLPTWAVDVPPLSGIVTAPDGLSVHITGSYYPGQTPVLFDSVSMPGYIREGGKASSSSGIFNAKISTKDGAGEYVMHSGGGSNDRAMDLVGDTEGNIYTIGYQKNLVMYWGHNLKTTVVETDGIDPTMTEASNTHGLVAKISASTESIPECLTTCADNTDQAVIESNSCFIDGKCYSAGDNGDPFGKSCFHCDPTQDQRNWVEAPSLGVTQCYIENQCWAIDEANFYQRRTWSATIFSICQICSPADNALEWSTQDGYDYVDGGIPPNDCAVAETGVPVPAPIPALIPAPASPLGSSTSKASSDSDDDGLGGGAIAGIFIGSFVGLAILAFGASKVIGGKRQGPPESFIGDNVA